MEDAEKDVRLLMVDDEEEFLAATAQALGRRGIAVTTATRGKEALRLAEKSEFDVVLLDVKMPGMDGVEVFRRLQRRQPGLPIIILTGHATVSQAFETAKEGLLDYVAKPCDVDDLVCKLRAARRLRPSRSATPGTAGEIVHVLLIDDETDLLESLEQVLARRGMRVFTATNGPHGLEILGEQPIDVVILDAKMPDMDGLGVLWRVKQDKPTVEVILLTGYPTPQAAIDSLRLGAFDYVVKPPDVELLVERIRKARARRLEAIAKAQEDLVRDILSRYPG